MGPLEIEQKKRVVGKRTKFEKNKADEKKPQEITEADITRSENETTKNVAAVSLPLICPTITHLRLLFLSWKGFFNNERGRPTSLNSL